MNDLPPIARDIARAVGVKGLLEIVERAGGCKIFVPKSPAPDHELVRLIGIDLARRLAKNYGGGGEIEIPTLREPLRGAEKRRIVSAVREGRMTVNQAARALSVTTRCIYKLKQRKNDARQPALFDFDAR